MKRAISFLLLLMPIMANAYDAYINGLYYNLFEQERKAEVTFKEVDPFTKYINGRNVEQCYSGDIFIPSKISYKGVDYKVTSIDDYAFINQYSLTTISIPNSISYIGIGAFYGCQKLKSVIIPESVTTISESTFYGCIQLSSIVIPESVEAIEKRAFYDSDIDSINIPKGVKNIGAEAFYSCSRLSSIIVSDSIESIGENAFGGTPWIYSQPYGLVYIGHILYSYRGEIGGGIIEIKEGTRAIAGGAFANQYMDFSVIIPEGVINIGESAFSCSGITSINLPNSVLNIGESAFYYCEKLNAITIPEGLKEIKMGTFFVCRNLTSVIIPEGLLSIGAAAFKNCTNLKSISLPKTLVSIEDDAFAYCNSLTSIIIPDSVYSIGNSAFYNCNNLTSIIIPDSVYSIGNSAFENCTSLSSINIPEKVEYVGGHAFDNTAWYDNQPDGEIYIGKTYYKLKGNVSYETNVSIKSGTKYIAGDAFNGCNGITSVIIPEGVTSIGSRAFFRCHNLAEISIPESVTTIGNNAFYDCTCLKSVAISPKVNHIGSSAFYDCISLKSFNIPDSITTIEYNTFYGCIGITTIRIPVNIITIESGAFDGCKLETVYTKNPLTKIANKSFSERTIQHAMLYIPVGTWGEAVYDGDWYQFNNIREITTNKQSLSPNRAYTMMNAQSFEYLVYDENGNDISLVHAFYNINESDSNNSWQIIDHQQGKIVKNIGSKKYMNITPNGEIKLTDSPVVLDFADNKNGMSINGSQQEWVFVTNNSLSTDVPSIDEQSASMNKTISTDNTYYSLDGKLLNYPQQGINIGIDREGNIRKYYMK